MRHSWGPKKHQSARWGSQPSRLEVPPTDPRPTIPFHTHIQPPPSSTQHPAALNPSLALALALAHARRHEVRGEHFPFGECARSRLLFHGSPHHRPPDSARPEAAARTNTTNTAAREKDGTKLHHRPSSIDSDNGGDMPITLPQQLPSVYAWICEDLCAAPTLPRH